MKSTISHFDGTYQSSNKKHGLHLKISYQPNEDLIENKRELDRWLTERYCLFLERIGKIRGNDIHHFEWPLQRVKIFNLDLHYRFKNLVIDCQADLYHYSNGVYVPTWGQVEQ